MQWHLSSTRMSYDCSKLITWLILSGFKNSPLSQGSYIRE